MKRLVIACMAAAAISACGGETKLPEATGKANVWSINAIPTSPEIGFFIEERPIGGISFKGNTLPRADATSGVKLRQAPLASTTLERAPDG